MFNLSPITTARMATTTNDMAVQNMFFLINNILPHNTCLKPRGRIFNKGAKNLFFASTHGAPTLVDFYTYVELNKNTIVECPCESMAYKAIKVE
jgi:hypothetical protein